MKITIDTDEIAKSFGKLVKNAPDTLKNLAGQAGSMAETLASQAEAKASTLAEQARKQAAVYQEKWSAAVAASRAAVEDAAGKPGEKGGDAAHASESTAQGASDASAPSKGKRSEKTVGKGAGKKAGKAGGAKGAERSDESSSEPSPEAAGESAPNASASGDSGTSASQGRHDTDEMMALGFDRMSVSAEDGADKHTTTLHVSTKASVTQFLGDSVLPILPPEANTCWIVRGKGSFTEFEDFGLVLFDADGKGRPLSLIGEGPMGRLGIVRSVCLHRQCAPFFLGTPEEGEAVDAVLNERGKGHRP